jgi:hypothetical protein
MIDNDAHAFAKMHADYLKLDGCNSNSSDWQTGYPHMTVALNRTGRPIVYACSWPFFQTLNNQTVNCAFHVSVLFSS